MRMFVNINTYVCACIYVYICRVILLLDLCRGVTRLHVIYGVFHCPGFVSVMMSSSLDAMRVQMEFAGKICQGSRTSHQLQ